MLVFILYSMQKQKLEIKFNKEPTFYVIDIYPHYFKAYCRVVSSVFMSSELILK